MWRKIVPLAVGVLVVAAAAWYWFVYLAPAPVQPTNPGTASQAVNQPGPTPSTNQPAQVQPEPVDPTLGWRVLAQNFAERYGSYSTDLPFQNLKTLSSLVTPAFQERLSAQVAGGSTGPGFYSVTTRALMAENQAGGTEGMTVNVSTQRSERFSRDGAPQVSYAVLQVELKQVSGTWLVDSAAWQKK